MFFIFICNFTSLLLHHLFGPLRLSFWYCIPSCSTFFSVSSSIDLLVINYFCLSENPFLPFVFLKGSFAEDMTFYDRFFLIEFWWYYPTIFCLKFLVVSQLQSGCHSFVGDLHIFFGCFEDFSLSLWLCAVLLQCTWCTFLFIYSAGYMFFLVSFGYFLSSGKFIAIIFSNLFLPYLFHPLRTLMAYVRLRLICVLDSIIISFLLLAQFSNSVFYLFSTCLFSILCLMSWLFFMLSSTHGGLFPHVFGDLCLWHHHHYYYFILLFRKPGCLNWGMFL